MSRKVRIEIANLVPKLRVVETGQEHFVGLLNRRHLEKGRRVYGSVGGAAELTAIGLENMKGFGAEFLSGSDARLLVDYELAPKVLQYFQTRDAARYEIDPKREVIEELTQIELPGAAKPILVLSEIEQIGIVYAKSMFQASDQSTTRGSSLPDEIEVIRYFHLFEIAVPEIVFSKLCGSEFVHLFTPTEVETTKQGLVHGRAIDGSEIASNLFW